MRIFDELFAWAKEKSHFVIKASCAQSFFDVYDDSDRGLLLLLLRLIDRTLSDHVDPLFKKTIVMTIKIFFLYQKFSFN
jgi:hypothetical protein